MCCQQIVKILFAAICLQLLPSPTHKYIHKQCHHYFPSTMAFEYYQYCKICGAWRRKVILHESIKRIATIFARDSQWKSNKMFGLTIVYIACTSTRSRIFNASRSRLVYGNIITLFEFIQANFVFCVSHSCHWKWGRPNYENAILHSAIRWMLRSHLFGIMRTSSHLPRRFCHRYATRNTHSTLLILSKYD